MAEDKSSVGFDTSKSRPQKYCGTSIRVLILIISLCALSFHFYFERDSVTKYLSHFHPLRRKPTISIKPIVPLTLVLPCESSDWPFLGRLLESVANQDVLPSETVMVLSIPDAQVAEITNFLHGSSVLESGQNATYVANAEDSPSPHLNSTNFNTGWISSWHSRIPQLKVFIRSGKFFPGHNRVFGAEKAQNDLVSFFDCDDYMHAQRIGILWKVFDKHPEIEAAIHCLTPFSDRGDNDGLKWLDVMKKFNDTRFRDSDIRFPYSSSELAGLLPTYAPELLKTPWNISDPATEINIGDTPTWWFHAGMDLPNIGCTPHNGWLSIRKYILNEVPYPVELEVGEDSLYNWRLLQSSRGWNCLPLPLGLYVGAHGQMRI